MKTCRTSRVSSGFTLIELVISAALAAMILVSSYLCLSSALASKKLLEPRIDVLQNARVAMAILTADLRCACPIAAEYQFLGMHRVIGEVTADNLDFGTHNYAPKRPGEGDFCQVSFFLDKDPQSGEFVLWRRRNPTIGLDPLAGGSREEIARGVRGVRFEYYDGFDWYDTWGDADGRSKARGSAVEQPNLTGMPEAVRITLAFDPKPKSRKVRPGDEETLEPPMIFRTVTRLNLAAVSSSSSGGAPSGAGAGTSPSPGSTTGEGAVN